MQSNQGFDPQEIEDLKKEIAEGGKSFVVIESEDNSDDFMNFYFIGIYEGREVIYDAAIYTLKLQHSSEIYELAEHKVAQKYPNYKSIVYEEDENGDIEPLNDEEEEIGLYMTEVMDELEEDEAVKVKEHVDVDPNIDYGIGLDVGLHVDKITDQVIEKFIKDYNEETLKLDPTHYSFQFDDEA
ncbi:hypothetical protein [Roseivirga sp.]|uniref:hypothetical protein n=1 Tax=Roseivirga sp. TaxID=1964215 RepID=UPI003B515A1F